MEEKTTADPTDQSLRKIQLTGIAFIGIGIAVLYFALFVTPAEDAILF